jgi:hypothetical protein
MDTMLLRKRIVKLRSKGSVRAATRNIEELEIYNSRGGWMHNMCTVE